MTKLEMIDRLNLALTCRTEQGDCPTCRGYISEVIDALQAQDGPYAALEAVEEWWLREGMHAFEGAPAAIFMCRAALDVRPQ